MRGNGARPSPGVALGAVRPLCAGPDGSVCPDSDERALRSSLYPPRVRRRRATRRALAVPANVVVPPQPRQRGGERTPLAFGHGRRRALWWCSGAVTSSPGLPLSFAESGRRGTLGSMRSLRTCRFLNDTPSLAGPLRVQQLGPARMPIRKCRSEARANGRRRDDTALQAARRSTRSSRNTSFTCCG
jgi:hypothetical protein